MKTKIASVIVLALLPVASEAAEPAEPAEVVYKINGQNWAMYQINGQNWAMPVPLPLPTFGVQQANDRAWAIAQARGGRLPSVQEFRQAQSQLANSPFNNGLFRVYFTSSPGTQWSIVLGRPHQDSGNYSGHDFIAVILY